MKRVFPDDTDDIIHGVNCDCEDSCLEYQCYCCGYEWSSNIYQEECEDCGAKIKPDIYEYIQECEENK